MISCLTAITKYLYFSFYIFSRSFHVMQYMFNLFSAFCRYCTVSNKIDRSSAPNKHLISCSPSERRAAFSTYKIFGS